MECETVENSHKNMFFAICITQIVCVAVIFCSILIIKFFFAPSFAVVKTWCENNLFEQTKIASVDEDVVL